jgi:hypothetical protein
MRVLGLVVVLRWFDHCVKHLSLDRKLEIVKDATVWQGLYGKRS